MKRGRGGRLIGALMVGILLHAGSLGNLPATASPNAGASGASTSVTMHMDEIRGKGWWEKLACLACVGMSAALTTVSGGMATGTLIGCVVVCHSAFTSA